MASTLDVQLPQGTVRGLRGPAVNRYGAIPYARPPVGALRFRAPEPADWNGLLDATGVGTIAPQRPARLRDVMGDLDGEQSEDCLHLTIWTPAADGAPRPVVVWIHGGAWQSGAGALPWYDGSRLAEEGDVVVVAINYRLGAPGWLCLPGLPANLGLLDQEAALEWVVRHIGAFGGDAGRITVMGQSAGASCIAALCGRQPRFHRAILQSGALGRGFRSLEDAYALGQLFMEAAGAADLEALRALPIERLLDAQQAPSVLSALSAGNYAGPLFTVVADGTVVPRDAQARMADWAGARDVLVGTTRDEMAAFPGYGTDADSRAVGEAAFGAGSRQWADDARRAGRQAWSYRVDFGPTERFGACHCIELPLLFGTLEAFGPAPMLAGADPGHVRDLSARMRAAWLRFIRGGSPGWDPAPAMQIFD
ncbi:MAG: carboxylesterase/lipase family protein [Pigmentiphaga sp.]|uniref:Carboxylic ester hydrolase n=1 Tax=Pigmentiphaga daeguensis TaxID=414049 RepID=A0ABN1CXV3_9BURK|nr:carboxylesterase family protein [Pigmentiphaga sp. NML030171]OVZ62078.1 carboxylesterase [Pigmentiphaga sp. NML030171]